VFLDVKGSIEVKKPGYEMNTAKNHVIEDLESARVKVALTESGDIKWKGSYYAFSWETTSAVLAWSEGELHFNEKSAGSTDITYCVSLRPLQLALLAFSLTASLFHIFAQLGIGVLLFFLFSALFAYMIAYFHVKFWLKGFIKRHIHALD
jgi:hypothetical protein